MIPGPLRIPGLTLLWKANQRPRRRMADSGDPWIDCTKYSAVHSQPPQTHSPRVSASACLRESVTWRTGRATSTPFAVFKWPGSSSTGMAAQSYRGMPGTPTSTHGEKQVCLWMMKSQPQDFPKILSISSCSRMWWKTPNWCLVLRAGHMGGNPVDPAIGVPSRSPQVIACQLWVPSSHLSALQRLGSVTKYWGKFSPCREPSVFGNFIAPVAMHPPVLPLGLRPVTGWSGSPKAQLPCLKERHALRHNLCSRTPSDQAGAGTWHKILRSSLPAPIHLLVSPGSLSLMNLWYLNPWLRVHFQGNLT